MFTNTHHQMSTIEPSKYDDVPLRVLLPHTLNEFKIVVLIGFKIYLPFGAGYRWMLTVTILMGMMMLPLSIYFFFAVQIIAVCFELMAAHLVVEDAAHKRPTRFSNNGEAAGNMRALHKGNKHQLTPSPTFKPTLGRLFPWKQKTQSIWHAKQS